MTRSPAPVFMRGLRPPARHARPYRFVGAIGRRPSLGLRSRFFALLRQNVMA
ncbi:MULTISPECIES: hypothetical protein [unclassified Methylosinus]|uniref:hypothetical protein n=1 Tax=unclassified Methylosinus TaxID=2624500 RepID=UPI0004AF31C3|nr:MULTISPECIES: hypothetical protein [unclassified Methylosinus]